ncbi:MAG TPA: phage tail length tape measure family protein, partial [Kaistia sp.]|nr:phage tail length tape measure family protein [Kaistia sp.]
GKTNPTMATLETIRRLSVRGSSEGLDKVAADLRAVDAAQKQVAASAAPLATVTDTVAKRVTSSAGAYDRLRQSIDLDYRAQVQIEKGQRAINAALEQGVIDAQGAAQAIDMLTARYARLHGSMSASVAPGQLIGAQTSGASAAQSASVFEEAARAEQMMAKEAVQLRAQINPLGAALDQLNTELAQYSRLASAGAISASELAQAQTMARARYDDTAGSLSKMGANSKLATHEVTNLTYQLNDIATGLATGQSPFMILAQQSGQVSQIFGNRGLRAALMGTFAGLASMVTPVTLAIGGLAAGGFAASLIFRKVRGESETLETVLKRHQETVRTLKDSYGEAAAKLGDFAAEGRNVADALSRLDQNNLQKQLRSVSEAAQYSFGDLARGASGGGFAIAEQFQSLAGPLEKLFQTIRDGHPDIQAFRSEISDLANLNPTNAALQTAYEKAMAITKGAWEAQSAILAMAGAMSTLGQQTSIAIQQLEALLKVAPSASEQADELYRKAMLSATNPGQRASIEASYLDAQDRIAGTKVPLPPRKPNYLGANPDGSYGAAAGKAAEREANAYRDLVKNAQDRIDQMHVEIETVGMADAAAEKYRMRQELLASATDKGRKVSEPMRKEIEKLADEYAALAEQVAKARLQQDLLFDRRQLGRSSIDQTVASALRGAGLPEDMNSTEAQMIRLNEQLSIGKDMAMDFASSFISGLRDGQSVLESLGNALNRIADKLIEMATDQLISGLFGNLMGAFGGGGASAITGSLWADGGAFAGGNVIPFAKGTAFTNSIVNSPTVFAMANGAGLMGEAGPEAVMPLRRMAGGRLGVEAVGNGGDGGAVYHFETSTPIIIQGNASEDTVGKIEAMFIRREKQFEARIPDIMRRASQNRQLKGVG